MSTECNAKCPLDIGVPALIGFGLLNAWFAYARFYANTSLLGGVFCLFSFLIFVHMVSAMYTKATGTACSVPSTCPFDITSDKESYIESYEYVNRLTNWGRSVLYMEKPSNTFMAFGFCIMSSFIFGFLI